jgi:hypothetical protein
VLSGERQGEDDRAPYCTPTYAAMEAGASWVLLGHPKTALPILEKSRAEWLDYTQVRDYALCVSRLAMAYAAAGELSGLVRLLMRSWHLLRGSARAGWSASSACSTVGWTDGGRIRPWLACEGG